ncbi:MAG: glycosyltransferase family 4 protein [Planctomycetes bacterium]|nr:glycosyltransferase family 4 protein [Planctomycetota bacterium]
MIISKDRLAQECAMLNRLTVGLLDEGIQVIRVVPECQMEQTPKFGTAVSFANQIEVSMPVPRMLRKKRRDEVVELFLKQNVEMVFGFGKDAMQLALDIEKVLEINVLCEVLSMKAAKKVKRKSRIWRWFAPTPSIEQEIARRVGPERTALIPLGVTNHHTIHATDRVSKKCIVLLDAANDYKNSAEILALLAAKSNVHLFIEMTGKHQQRLWKQITTLSMHDRVTCLHDVGALRALVVQADLLVLPSVTMEVRTVLLDAMLSEVPTLATQIQGFDMLIDEETAIISNGSWDSSLSLLLDDKRICERIGSNGSSLIAQKYGSAVQIAAFKASFTLN